MSREQAPAPRIAGNFEDKYHTDHLIKKAMVTNFLRKLESMLHAVNSAGITRVCEIGCGEGELLKTVHAIFQQAHLFAADISDEVVAEAKRNCAGIPVEFSIQNAEELGDYADSSFDLVICCEVLEHLSNPQKGLTELFRISRDFVLVSVPNEPIWRILNIARVKYIRTLGNTPGHLNHWNVSQFRRLLAALPGCTTIERVYPLPWQMALLRKNAPTL